MKFGPRPTAEALGTILAHSHDLPSGHLRKGVILRDADLAALTAAGVAQVVVAALGPQDLDENAAALQLAQALVPNPKGQGLHLSAAFTGRVNLLAAHAGIVALDAPRLHALNAQDPALTLATLPPFTRVEAGTLVGTVKIISYGLARPLVDSACAPLDATALFVRPVVLKTADLILTEVAGQDPKLAAKGKRAVEARLKALGMALATVQLVAHDSPAIAAALLRCQSDITLILTGSATSDLYDTAPQALRDAGGQVTRFGMPVDPGNLLFLGQRGAQPVIGLPGCARSPALNGADWVLERLACGLAPSQIDIAAMGVGGLLKEIATRPQPREKPPLS